MVLLRDAPGGVETLLVHRNAAVAFAGGMAVFPGGRVEDADWLGVDRGDEVGAARNAAARETHEEAGLVVDPTALVAWSHWQPPLDQPKRFLTWFFVGDAPDAVVEVDGGEIVDHVWMRPVDAIERFHVDELLLMAPTYVTITSLVPYRTVAEVLAAARSRPPQSFMATIHRDERGIVFLYEGDAALAAGDIDLERPGGRRRLYAPTVKPWRWEERER